MANEKIALYGRMYPSHQSPQMTATFEFEHPTIQNDKLRFQAVGLRVTGLNFSGPVTVPQADGTFETQPQILALSGRIQLSEHELLPLGTMSLDPFCFANSGHIHWDWELTGPDIERIIEKNRHDRDIQLHMHVDGILGVQLPGKGVLLFNVRGANYFQLSRTTWNDFLRWCGYSGKFVEKLMVNSTVLQDESWNSAIRRLEGARRQLSIGNTYLALEECLSAIEKVTPEPYNPKKWTVYLQDLSVTPDSKLDAIAKFFGGIGTYLNRVGHHHSRDAKDEETGEHIRPALDAYEAEILLAATQLLLTYVDRLRK